MRGSSQAEQQERPSGDRRAEQQGVVTAYTWHDAAAALSLQSLSNRNGACDTDAHAKLQGPRLPDAGCEHTARRLVNVRRAHIPRIQGVIEGVAAHVCRKGHGGAWARQHGRQASSCCVVNACLLPTSNDLWLPAAEAGCCG